MQRTTVNLIRTGAARSGFSSVAMIWFLCFTSAGLWLLLGGHAKPQPPTPHARHLITKNIEDIRVGDYVLAKDPNDAGPPTAHRVTALPRNWTQHIVHVQVEGGGEVQATRNHPFWVGGRGWIEARELHVGDRLRDEQDRPVMILSLKDEGHETDTYNLTIEGVHAYYVRAGDAALLVHNVDVLHVDSFDEARRIAFDHAGLTDSCKITSMGKPDWNMGGTYTEFKGAHGAEVAYDGPHADMNPATGHDGPHISAQSPGKRWSGAARRLNIRYDGPPGPVRPLKDTPMPPCE